MTVKFKEYKKTGIYGMKCGKHYITPDSIDEKIYNVIDGKKNLVAEGYTDVEDAKWFIKYHELNPKRKEIFNKLAKLANWELSDTLEKCIRGDDVLGNPDDNEWLYKAVIDLRNRKKDMKPEIPGDDTSYQKLSMEKEKISNG